MRNILEYLDLDDITGGDIINLVTAMINAAFLVWLASIHISLFFVAISIIALFNALFLVMVQVGEMIGPWQVDPDSDGVSPISRWIHDWLVNV